MTEMAQWLITTPNARWRMVRFKACLLEPMLTVQSSSPIGSQSGMTGIVYGHELLECQIFHLCCGFDVLLVTKSF